MREAYMNPNLWNFGVLGLSLSYCLSATFIFRITVILLWLRSDSRYRVRQVTHISYSESFETWIFDFGWWGFLRSRSARSLFLYHTRHDDGTLGFRCIRSDESWSGEKEKDQVDRDQSNWMPRQWLHFRESKVITLYSGPWKYCRRGKVIESVVLLHICASNTIRSRSSVLNEIDRIGQNPIGRYVW